MRTILFLSLIALLGITLFFFLRQPNVFNPQSKLDNREYKPQLDTVRQIRKQLKKKKAPIAVQQSEFISVMTDRIFPYWYGTRWEFYGTTETPNEGTIACGYFVTTTLRDAGVPLNRVKLAQCASEEMIRSLCSPSNIHHLSGMNITDLEKRMKKLGNGLYIVGLDNHTGFILISAEGNYFIHSGGSYPIQVVKQKFSEAGLLAKSKYRVVGKISADKDFLKRWLEKS